MHAADGYSDQPQASSPGKTGKAGAIAAKCVSCLRTQPWKARRKPGFQPKMCPGTVAADLSPWPFGALKQKNLAVFDELLNPDVVFHNASTTIQGLEAYKQFRSTWFAIRRVVLIRVTSWVSHQLASR
jgi:hypothetical protein